MCKTQWYNRALFFAISPKGRFPNMEQNKKANKLSLHQETLRNLLNNPFFELRTEQQVFSGPKSVCRPVCTP